MPKHPIQPLALDENEVLRFKRNAIVCHLLEYGGINLNMLALLNFSKEDREQFAQLIGYSLSGFSELSYADPTTVEAAERMAEDGTSADAARVEVLEATLANIREGMKGSIAELFGIHPDDLTDH